MKDFVKSDLLESDIELKLADCPEQVSAIVRETIQKVYPHYYPSGAVQFFLDLHSEARIKEVMSYEEIYLAMVQENIIGTGSIRKNEICRLFILPEYQGKGYGSRLMDLLEAWIFENYPKVHIDASFPAESMYLRRGYQIISYEKMETENGDFLCYHTMEKEQANEVLAKGEISQSQYDALQRDLDEIIDDLGEYVRYNERDKLKFEGKCKNGNFKYKRNYQ